MIELMFTGAKVVTADGVLAPGWVQIAGGRVVGVGVGAEPDSAARRIELGGRYVLPGFIDLHVHGAAEATFDSGAEQIAKGLAAHRRHGTTRSLISLVTGPVDAMVERIAAAAQFAAEDPHVLGVHLEGPFLSEARRGVHDPSALIDPEPAVLQRLLDAGAGHVRVVTLAPERQGGLDAVRTLVDAGIHAAVGHSDATYDQALAAFAAGADLVTHAFNGMRPLHHRDPAIIGAAMDSPQVVLEAINDGVHLHPAAVRMLKRLAPQRVALITDAMAAACAGDGDYLLAGFPVRVTDGVARLVPDDPAKQGSIAGSTLTMDVAVQRAVSVVGMSVLDAVKAASLVPARVLGVEADHGVIAVGKVADLLIADADLNIDAVLVGGEWSDERRP